MQKVSLVGVTGYTGIELFRLLQSHPSIQINQLFSRNHAGEDIADIYPQLSGVYSQQLVEFSPEAVAPEEIVFTALPHGISQEIVAELRQQGNRVIDLSGDFRYRDQKVYEEWYQREHNYPELLQEAVYGLPELKRKQIKQAKLVANPGCYPTASLLGLYPLLEEGLLQPETVIIDAKSGVSGAGKSLKRVTHFVEADENVGAYSPTGHRHTSEIEGLMAEYTGGFTGIAFTPHLIPIKRGILATIYTKISGSIGGKALIGLYRQFYDDEPFVHLLTGDNLPQTHSVMGTNRCQLSLALDQRSGRLKIMSAIDNLGKGAAGQAVQNLNLMAGFDEELGLTETGIFP
ncbi:MAG: N-acetyl-gamma-glutamyl-phosphate reductase [Bacillota bacterium]